MEWFWRHYAARPDDRLDPRASPLRSRDFRGQPPALVLTAQYDPLRDEGEQYARRLADSGAAVELIRYDGMIHGFVRRLRQYQVARRALQDAAAYLRTRLRR
jgi:acetyl esterase